MSYDKVKQVKSRVIIGLKQTLKAMKHGEVSEVFVADDAAGHIKSQVIRLANDLNIPCKHVDSMKKLGAACGIDVGASTVAIKR